MKPDDVRKNILGNEIAYIPQAAMNALNPTQKIIRFVEDVIHAHDPKMPRKDIYDLAKERFQITHHFNNHILGSYIQRGRWLIGDQYLLRKNGRNCDNGSLQRNR